MIHELHKSEIFLFISIKISFFPNRWSVGLHWPLWPQAIASPGTSRLAPLLALHGTGTRELMLLYFLRLASSKSKKEISRKGVYRSSMYNHYRCAVYTICALLLYICIYRAYIHMCLLLVTHLFASSNILHDALGIPDYTVTSRVGNEEVVHT